MPEWTKAEFDAFYARSKYAPIEGFRVRRAGHIVLQDHGDGQHPRFRNIWLREMDLSPEAIVLAEERAGERQYRDRQVHHRECDVRKRDQLQCDGTDRVGGGESCPGRRRPLPRPLLSSPKRRFRRKAASRATTTAGR